MILVTGTKRSGTSLWMQALIAAGFPPVGEAFPVDWGERLRGANPEGFFESTLRGGIFYATNPDPRTGQYLFPEQVEHHVVKVFPHGVVRTDRAFIGRVVVTIRPFREVVASVRSLHALEDAGRPGPPPPRRDPALEWWAENYALVRDIATRRYAAHVESFGRLVREPDRVLREVLGWIGRGDASRAAAAVRPEHRHFDGTGPGSDPEEADVFDALYEAIDARRPLSPAFAAKLDETHRALVPRLLADEARVRR